MAKHDVAPEPDVAQDEPVADDAAAEGHRDGDIARAADDLGTDTEPKAARHSPVRLATLAGLVVVVVAATLVGFLGHRAMQSQEAADRNRLFLEVARQGAINLTTIDWQRADADVQRILESATGAFYDDFSKRAQPFIEVVKQAKSSSVGTVTEAGLESEAADHAQILVAVAVKTTNAGAADPSPRAWRMRIDVQRLGDQAKVSNVEFVP